LQTANFTFTSNSDLGKRMYVGQHLYVYVVGEFGSAYYIPLDFARIVTLDIGAGTGTLADVSLQITNGALSVMFYFMPYLIAPLVIGDCTSGSANVTSCVLSNSITSLLANVVIQNPYFPPGTRIISYSAGTLVLSHAALASKTNIEILSANWEQTHFANAPNTVNSYGIPYKVFDRVVNTEVDSSDVLEWVCIKSGVSNSTRLPEFKAIYKSELLGIVTTTNSIQGDGSLALPIQLDNDNDTPGNYMGYVTNASGVKGWSRVAPAPIALTPSIDVSQAIAADLLVNTIVIKNAAGLAAFKIGTTPGGEEISAAQIITAGVATPININYPSDAGITLYFGGIDSATTIKIYLQ
jgi:hypothetical protein